MDRDVGARVAAVLCVPFIASDGVLGVLYLATMTSDTVLDRDHLQLATAISGIGALAIDNLSRFDELDRQVAE